MNNSNNNIGSISDEEDDSSQDESSPGSARTDSLSTNSEPSLTSPLSRCIQGLGSPNSPLIPTQMHPEDWGFYFRSQTASSLPFPVFSGIRAPASSSPRPPVGTDPRDSKNPLSVWQLTGRSQSKMPLSENSSAILEPGESLKLGGATNGERRFL